ncbi:hypothetical protein [Halorussus ruber]|uniref:hypothetical protein n=1 Tax=Halorussus ruber TaxID=1126238 RepID=UPI001092F443|nr:hypothetical protein [Halorussus ruber]
MEIKEQEENDSEFVYVEDGAGEYKFKKEGNSVLRFYGFGGNRKDKYGDEGPPTEIVKELESKGWEVHH